MTIIEVKISPKNFIKNGAYQKIFWLGVCGYIIVNEHDKEILLVDPWPSYIELPNVYSPKIVHLANWLVEKVKKEKYTLVGIIGTHEHFDHIADIPGLYYNLNKNDITLPPLYADEGTLDKIKSSWRVVTLITDREDFVQFKDIVQCNSLTLKGRNGLFYNDKVQSEKEDNHVANYPLRAGTKLDDINIGKFVVTPYIWDHSSTTNTEDDWPGVKSGDYQRCTVIFLKCRSDPKQKTLFLVGSAGEMNERYTGGFVNDRRIETDILIMSMPHKIALLSTYEKKLSSLAVYQVRNIKVNDKIIATHFENFINYAHIMKSNYVNGIKATREQLRIKNYAIKLRYFEVTREVPEKDRTKEIYYMRRFMIEYMYIFLDNYDEVLIEEKKDGDFWLRFSTVGYF